MYEYRIKEITKIVDGDTIDAIIDLGFDILHSARIRLYGIDTPESRTRDLEEKKYGLLAKKFLTNCLKTEHPIILRTHKEEKGKFGRILGEIIIDEKNINTYMIESYHAVPYQGQSKYDIDELHMNNREMLSKDN
jgi:micrococcal nuclease